jgi:signal transduction histidine kinase
VSAGESKTELRILVLAPTGRDASLACEVLQGAGIDAEASKDISSLCVELERGAGALLIAEEALTSDAQDELSFLLQEQPDWSDLPIIVFAASADTESSKIRMRRVLEVLGNVTTVDRPVRIATLVTTMKAALRARKRQYAARRTLQALERREAELQQAGQRKDEFLAMLAHELRNPMAAISMALNMIERTDRRGKTGRYQDTAKRQMGNLVRLVDDLLDVSRITRGTVELRKERLDLTAIIHNAIAATRPVLDERRHRLSLSVGPGPLLLDGDPTRLEQVMTNLLTNAAKYTEPGGEIAIRVSRQGTQGRPQAVVSVADNGRGIPAEMLDNIFDLFVQVQQTLDRKLGGLGLGLTLVKRLVEMHGGFVQAASDGPGRGSEFTVTLPLSTAASDGTAPGIGEGSAGGDDALMLPFSKRRIVLVEDSDDIRETLKEFLEDLGHEVAEASNGPDGVARILEFQPDVALVDVGLPGIDGFELDRRVRMQPGRESF